MDERQRQVQCLLTHLQQQGIPSRLSLEIVINHFLDSTFVVILFQGTTLTTQEKAEMTHTQLQYLGQKTGLRYDDILDVTEILEQRRILAEDLFPEGFTYGLTPFAKSLYKQ